MGLGGVNGFLPYDLSGSAVNGQNGELEFVKWVQVVMGTGWLLWYGKFFARMDGTGQVNMISPQDGRGMAKTG